ncbi:hypothetical protein ANCCAN_07422 [Ancylostoma caninum]|uniref:Collagen triple helix repeat protein n=1 Tax=Ancylostoma caninum TaxID=29170 RepID=A0A368GQA7_ANCCA|nr:hypothetical protein ANCCAN_07422 [Ancylostoma caninum]
MWGIVLLALLLPCQAWAQSGDQSADEESLFAFVSFVPDPSAMPPPPPPPRPPGPPDGCSTWGDWQQVTCWWPDQPLSSVAPACANAPNRTQWPDYINKLVQAKSEERYSMIVDEYKKRGKPPKCGFCSRSFECRARNDTGSRRQCLLKEVREIQRSCDDSKPCELSVENGGCPPPAFLARGRLGQLQGLLQHGKFQDFATQFFDISGIDLMETKKSRKGRSFDESQNSVSERFTGPDEDDNYPDGQIDPRSGKPFGPTGRGEQNPFGPGPSPFGPGPELRGRWRPGRPGGDAPFSPSPPGGRGPFGPDGARGRGGRFGPSGGRDGPFGPPGEGRFGPGGRSRGEPFGPRPRPGGEPFRPGGNEPFGPGGERPYGAGPHGRRVPFGPPGGREGERPFGPDPRGGGGPFGPGGDEPYGPGPHGRGGPFGPGGDEPFGPGPRGGGRRFGPGGDEAFPPPHRREPFGPPGRGEGPFGTQGRGPDGGFVPGQGHGGDRFGPGGRGGEPFGPSSWEPYGPAADQPFRPGPRGGMGPPGPGRGRGGPRGPGGRGGGPFGPTGGSGGFGPSGAASPMLGAGGRPRPGAFGPGPRPPVPGNMDDSLMPGSEGFAPEAKRRFKDEGTTAARSRRSLPGQPDWNIFPSMFNASWPSFPPNSPLTRVMRKFRPPTQRRNQKRPPPPPTGALDMIADLLHGTTCVSTGEKCLCCCGYYVPNLLRGTCEDIRNVMPGIDSAYKELAKTQKKKPRSIDSLDF